VALEVALGVAVALAGCSSDGATDASSAATSLTSTGATTSTVAATNPPTTVAAVAVATTAVPTTLPPPVYVFPFVGKSVSFGSTHHDYPAIDVFGCGATVVAPTDGTVLQTRDFDAWDPQVDSPANRGGKYVAMLGRDGVRYYFAHLASVAVVVGQAVQPGDPLGVMGQTGNARQSACHTHVGFSWPCPGNEWQVRRGEIWPQDYLDAWRNGEQTSPALEVYAAEKAAPEACATAMADPEAGDA